MSYNIGQFRSFSMSNYLQEIDLTESRRDRENPNIITDIITETIQTPGVGSVNFIDSCISVNLDNQTNYYLKFKAKKMEEHAHTINLKAISNNNDKNREQILGTFEIPAGNSEQFSSFEIVFSVNDIYNKIVWQLARDLIDYNGASNTQSWAGGRRTTIQANLYTVTDLLTSGSGSLKSNYPGLQYLSKIGIQGPPLMLMSINRQQIRIGKNGIYELNNGINITSISFIPSNENDIFIMDFEYQIAEEENSNEQNEEIQGGGQ